MTAKKISKKIIGIDLGTTNSCVAIQEGTSTRTILVDQSLTTPSYVTYGDQDELIVGTEAKRLIGTRTVLYDTKRLIGKTFSALDPKYIKSLGYKVTQGQDDNIVIELETVKGTKKKSSAVEVAAQILQKIKKAADDYLGDEEAKNCVITVPAYFNSTQREQTKQAAELAGLNVVRIINEPTAAALFYGIQKVFAGKEGKQTLLVYDLGGGTFDLSILEIEGGVFEVKSTKGDNWLGGNDIDTAIVQAIIEQTGMSCTTTQRAMLTLAAEGAKKTLSGNTNQALITVPYFDGVKPFSFTLTRAQFQSVLKPFIQRTESLVKQILKDVSTDIDGYILVGGQTRTIEFRDNVAKIMGKGQIGGVDPDLSVAGGAAIQGANLSTDASDEEVKSAEIVLLDVNPISLGMKVQGGIMCHMIKANATIPTYFTQMFVPASHNQTEAHIEIFQGERGMADDNTPLGEIILPLANPGRRENRQISVTFEIDANGMLKVTSTDVQTNKTESIQIDALKSGKIPIEEIKRIREEGEKHAALDKKLVHIAELKNKAEATCFDLQDILDTHAAISKRTEYEDLIRRARSLCLQRLEDTNDIEQILNSLHEALLEAQKEAANLKNTKEDPNKNSDEQPKE